ncbi:Predicted aminopeptidase [Halopseudomonas sabulinigri]|uniref:Predicted aminopeptidase n=1 Tax=Halopseudomonas sabulinigri TaxID=472181 RepID=A0A1H1TX58_9GAMM|nr:aminopeptidase [Halopseudomonas sabulinigri]SDS64526.1 Predicted aminopeptidase [Halopseudomonas sabulinigri]
MRGLCLLLLIGLLPGCSSLSYLHHSWQGQRDLLARAEPLEQVLQNPATEPQLAKRLQQAQRIRAFASQQLKLPDNASYTRYADLQRPYALWNLFVAAPLSMDAVPHCYPFFGCIAYKGYFDQASADAAAEQWRAKGMEVYVAGIPAYSTIGWYDDPLLNSMLHWDDDYLAELLFHELAHQQYYVKDDTAFNESFASFVGKQGLREWRAAQGLGARQRDPRALEREFVQLLLTAREQLVALYASEASDSAKLAGKAKVFSQLRADYRQWRDQHWQGVAPYDHWFAGELNNARLLPFGLYDQWIPAFAQLYAQSSDWPDFYRRVEALGALPEAQRATALQRLLEASAPAKAD